MTKPHLARKRLPQPGDKHFGRARLTNGIGLLPTVDGRSVWGRIMRDTLSVSGRRWNFRPRKSMITSLVGHGIAVSMPTADGGNAGISVIRIGLRFARISG